MAYFDDFAKAVNDYASISVTLSIVDVVVQTGTSGSININEVWAFHVRVSNQGQLNMVGVTLHIEGQNGAVVSKTAAGPWSPSIISGSLTVHAHGTPQDTEKLFFKAPGAVKAAGTALVRAHIQTFDANLDHILNDHSGYVDPPAGTFKAQVFP
jgi:hypothetical protein